jgi:molybdopterin/thiamine biosynthesis adenylyltransferase
MSQRLISLDPGLARLQREGFNVRIETGHVVVRDVPYVAPNRQVRLCVLADAYNDTTCRPTDHTMYMAGEPPSDEKGVIQETMFAGDRQNQQPYAVGDGLTMQYRFSVKVVGEGQAPIPDENYYDKFVRYIERLGRHVRAAGSDLSAQTFPLVLPDEPGASPFKYVDTATSRAQIAAISKTLQGQRLAVVGLGGTGGYVLDLVAKTPVEEIHLYDFDIFRQHNAFRAPGAASAEDLKLNSKKVDYFANIYAKMRNGIVPHPEGATEDTIAQIASTNFVFTCMDAGEAKRSLIDSLVANGTSFIDCGMGLYEVEGKLAGIARVTTATPGMNAHLADRIPFSDGNADNEYAHNIQIADLNALNAALAVIRWKKWAGFYNDLEREHNSNYTVDGNSIANGDFSAG